VLGIFLFTTVSRTALEPTQPPIQWVVGALSVGVKRLGRETDNSPPSTAEVKECMELYLHSPNTPSWCGAQFKKSTGKLYLLYRRLGGPQVGLNAVAKKKFPSSTGIYTLKSVIINIQLHCFSTVHFKKTRANNGLFLTNQVHGTESFLRR
jgi:hypothetical protein